MRACLPACSGLCLEDGSAGAIEWPAPERLSNPAGVDYGYNGEATLLTKVKVPATAKPGSADLNADLKWLVCKEQCIPQNGHAKLTVQVAPKAVPDANGKQQIALTRAKLPKTLPSGKPMCSPVRRIFC